MRIDKVLEALNNALAEKDLDLYLKSETIKDLKKENEELKKQIEELKQKKDW